MKTKNAQEVNLLQKKLESLKGEKTSLEEKNKALQERNKKLAKGHKDDMEKLTKIQADADKQMVQSMKQIKDLAAERDLQAKELADLRTAA